MLLLTTVERITTHSLQLPDSSDVDTLLTPHATITIARQRSSLRSTNYQFLLGTLAEGACSPRPAYVDTAHPSPDGIPPCCASPFLKIDNTVAPEEREALGTNCGLNMDCFIQTPSLVVVW